MAGSKLIIPSLLLVSIMAMMAFSMVNAEEKKPEGPVALMDAFMAKEPTDKQKEMTMADGLPKKLKDALPPSIVEKLKAIKVKEVKQAVKNVKQMLKDLKDGKITPKEFMEKLKKELPMVNALLKDIKDRVTKAIEGMLTSLGRKKREAPSPAQKLLDDIGKAILDYLNPPPKNPWKKLLKKIKEFLKKMQDKIDPDKSLTQKIADALAKAFPNVMKPILQMPKVAEALGIKPPSKKK